MTPLTDCKNLSYLSSLSSLFVYVCGLTNCFERLLWEVRENIIVSWNTGQLFIFLFFFVRLFIDLRFILVKSKASKVYLVIFFPTSSLTYFLRESKWLNVMNHKWSFKLKNGQSTSFKLMDRVQKILGI